MNKHYHTLRLILGDQLNAAHSWYQEKDDGVLYLIAELNQELSYVKHHEQKVAAFFKAMACFSEALSNAGHEVLFLTLDDTKGYSDLPALIRALCDKHHITTFAYQRPDEYRLLTQLEHMSLDGIAKEIWDSEHFYLPFEELSDYFKPGKHHTMEAFYRKMRKRFNVLLKNDEPVGGQWNFDAKNRNKLKKEDLAAIPEPLCFSNDVRQIRARLIAHKVKVFGTCEDTLLWPVTRRQAKELISYFCEHLLVHFGTFQDAMTCQHSAKWSLYHSRISFALNAKIISPKYLLNEVINTFEARSDIDIAQVEGYVRQVLGWREYVRGIYWQNMPDYADKNALEAKRALPTYYWDGNTKMRCMKECISQSLETSYAHHIQRLMVTGNFALLTGLNPDEVDAWYLGIYIDAIEWVEMPNTRGMSLFADDGIIATKPYAGGGNYINKMSDYCKHCHYDVKEKTGSKACPFNSLYWGFMARHEDKFSNNHRIGMIYRNWQKQSDEQKEAVLKRANWCLDNLDAL